MVRKSKSRVIVIIIIAIGLCYRVPPCAAQAQSVGPLPVEDVLNVRELAELLPVAISPNDQLLAYTVRTRQKARVVTPETWAKTGVREVFTGTDICILNIGTGDSRNLTEGKDDNFMPVWSPDGHYLAFLSDRDGSNQARLWIWDAKRDEMRKVSDLNVRQLGQIEWSPDSQAVFVPIVPIGMSVDLYAQRIMSAMEPRSTGAPDVEPGATVMLYQSRIATSTEKEVPASAPWNLDMFLRDVVRIDIAGGKFELVAGGQRIASYEISPDGRQFAYTIPKRFEEPGSQQTLFDLVALDLTSHSERKLASDIRLDYDGAAFMWSPDGAQIGFHAGGTNERRFDCYITDVTDGKPVNVTKFPPSEPAQYKSSPLLWDDGGQIYFINHGALWRLSADREKVSELTRIPDHEIRYVIARPAHRLWTIGDQGTAVVLTHDSVRKVDGFYKVDLTTGESTKLLEKDQCYTCANVQEPFAVDRTGQRLVFIAEAAQHSPDLWTSGQAFDNVRRLTHLNPQFAMIELGTARVIDWLGDDGESLHGALLLPAGYKEGTRYPLVVWVYGGDSLSNHFSHFGLEGSGPFNMQLLATRGYAVLLPDAPQHMGTPLLDLAKTVLPGVNKVVEMGIADPARIGVIGHSYGGYSVLCLLVQTTRFKAAIVVDGMADLLGYYGEMQVNGAAFGISVEEQGQGLMGGTPWLYRDRYIDNSPVFYLDRIETPLLIAHGSKDTGVAPFLSDQIFVGLRRLGKEVEYAKYEGENHVPSYWSYPNQVDFCKRTIRWLSKYLSHDDRSAESTTR